MAFSLQYRAGETAIFIAFWQASFPGSPLVVTFPHANGYTVDDAIFAAAWKYLCDRYHAANPRELARLPNRSHITVMDRFGQQLSVEYLCKALVPNGYKGTSQATRRFLDANSHIVQPTRHPVRNPVNSRPVIGVEILHALPDVVPEDVEALFEGDADPNVEEIVKTPEGSNERDPMPNVPQGSTLSPTGSCLPVNEFVRAIHGDHFYKTYRGNRLPPVGGIVGWDDRLATYFWPNPGVGVTATAARLAPILASAVPLAAAVAAGAPWTGAQEHDSIALALEVFKWGGVPQKAATVNALNIRKVFEAAITGTIPAGTPMNSGWTKVAAMATNHLPTAAQHVIWDSRVSTSVVRRLDAIFYSHGKATVPACAKGIGLVNVGRGGTRPLTVAMLHYRWENGYKSWAAQIAGSAFVRSVCDALNAGVVETTRKGHWTVRDVEMVLFMDGY